jgi:hypothetical protein
MKFITGKQVLSSHVAFDLKNKILYVLKENDKVFHCSDYFVIILWYWHCDCVFAVVKLGCTEREFALIIFLWQKESVWSHSWFLWFSFPISVPHFIPITGFQIFPGKIIRDFVSGFCTYLLCHLMFNVRIFLCCVNLGVFDVPMLKLFCLGVIDCTKQTLFCTKMWIADIYKCMCTR